MFRKSKFAHIYSQQQTKRLADQKFYVSDMTRTQYFQWPMPSGSVTKKKTYITKLYRKIQSGRTCCFGVKRLRQENSKKKKYSLHDFRTAQHIFPVLSVSISCDTGNIGSACHMHMVVGYSVRWTLCDKYLSVVYMKNNRICHI